MTNMGHMSYNIVGNSRPNRGFRLNHRRFSVSRLLRARFVCLFRFLRCSYGQVLQCLKKSMGRNIPGTSSPGTNYGPSGIKRNSSSSSRRSLVIKEMKQKKGRPRSADCCRLRSYGRSNSFYAEAIADCLEFIKRSSVSVDQNP
ncbi:hypothetical protein D8674_042755 [Pyrus ussuriensis x Pyrus communis]|uniref:Uncharacterized protein n=1 Tax=Pyrus ussuriensis x Pyrus communis TaxID=2448454 RepID=A0A5N5IFX8_9ROSA|nr:hypothetical protein D8674_042755 [Pyrus ussuriensis x Pyrus communis]